MNRQALAFLTMFSLILMLSVYYVTLPSDTTSVISSEDGEDLSDGKQDTSKEEEVGDAEKLQQEISQKNDEEVKKHSDVVSSSDASDAQKKEALESIDTLKSDKAIMETVSKALKDANYMAAVEIISGTCKVSVFEQEDTLENAQTLMKLVSDQTTNKYLVEVSFK